MKQFIPPLIPPKTSRVRLRSVIRYPPPAPRPRGASAISNRLEWVAVGLACHCWLAGRTPNDVADISHRPSRSGDLSPLLFCCCHHPLLTSNPSPTIAPTRKRSLDRRRLYSRRDGPHALLPPLSRVHTAPPRLLLSLPLSRSQDRLRDTSSTPCSPVDTLLHAGFSATAGAGATRLSRRCLQPWPSPWQRREILLASPPCESRSRYRCHRRLDAVRRLMPLYENIKLTTKSNKERLVLRNVSRQGSS